MSATRAGLPALIAATVMALHLLPAQAQNAFDDSDAITGKISATAMREDLSAVLYQMVEMADASLKSCAQAKAPAAKAIDGQLALIRSSYPEDLALGKRWWEQDKNKAAWADFQASMQGKTAEAGRKSTQELQSECEQLAEVLTTMASMHGQMVQLAGTLQAAPAVEMPARGANLTVAAP